MKKIYEAPEILLAFVNVRDVITTSAAGETAEADTPLLDFFSIG